ncbi:MAG: hypothetical protein KG003_01590 [Bacteroidetes bacterium]|nr:hypothetical protein [Bacteroidota bacterium]
MEFDRGNGSKAFVTCREKAKTKTLPIDGNNYYGISIFKSGDDIGGNNYAIAYVITGNLVVSNLIQNKAYTFEVFEWDSASKSYLTSTTATITDSTEFLSANPKAFRIGNDSCDKSAVTLFKANVSASFPITKLKWTVAGKVDSTADDSIKLFIGIGGLHNYQLILTPSYGCKYIFQSSKPILIIPTPTVKMGMTPPGPCLTSSHVYFNDQSTLYPVPRCAYIRTWYFDKDDIATFPNQDRIFKPGKYRLVLVSETLYDNALTGCKDSVVVSFTNPNFEFPTYSCLKQGDSLRIQSPLKGFKYNWNNGDTTQHIWVKQRGWYSLAIMDSSKCVGTDSVFIDTCAPIINSIRALSKSKINFSTKAGIIEIQNKEQQSHVVFLFTPDGRKIQQWIIGPDEWIEKPIKSGNYIIGSPDTGYQWIMVP